MNIPTPNKSETASGAKQSIDGINGLSPDGRGRTVRLTHLDCRRGLTPSSQFR